MRKSLAIVVCGTMLLVGAMAFLAPADARRGARGGHHHHHAGHRGHRHHAAHRSYAAGQIVNRNINRNVNASRRIVYRNGVRGYWRNGRWIAVPLVAGAGVASATCAYEYNRWKATGSPYWRDRYNQCAN